MIDNKQIKNLISHEGMEKSDNDYICQMITERILELKKHLEEL